MGSNWSVWSFFVLCWCFVVLALAEKGKKPSEVVKVGDEAISLAAPFDYLVLRTSSKAGSYAAKSIMSLLQLISRQEVYEHTQGFLFTSSKRHSYDFAEKIAASFSVVEKTREIFFASLMEQTSFETYIRKMSRRPGEPFRIECEDDTFALVTRLMNSTRVKPQKLSHPDSLVVFKVKDKYMVSKKRYTTGFKEDFDDTFSSSLLSGNFLLLLGVLGVSLLWIIELDPKVHSHGVWVVVLSLILMIVVVRVMMFPVMFALNELVPIVQDSVLFVNQTDMSIVGVLWSQSLLFFRNMLPGFGLFLKPLGIAIDKFATARIYAVLFCISMAIFPLTCLLVCLVGRPFLRFWWLGSSCTITQAEDCDVRLSAWTHWFAIQCVQFPSFLSSIILPIVAVAEGQASQGWAMCFASFGLLSQSVLGFPAGLLSSLPLTAVMATAKLQ